MQTSRALLLTGGLVAAASIWTGTGAATADQASTPRTSTVVPAAPAAPLATPGAAYLDGVYCTGRSNCWAVGVRQAGTVTTNQVLHWNGKSWRHFPVPNPGGTGGGADSELAAVRCTTARDCWAVGHYRARGAKLNQMLHWNGRAWFAMRTPQPAGTGQTATNELTDVTCISARNCWATGFSGKLSSPELNEVLHWNGKSWSRQRVPEPGGLTSNSSNSLGSVRCPSATRCLAVGSYSTGPAKTFNEALTWAGHSWVRQRVPDPSSGLTSHGDELFGLGCGAPTSCFAVGISAFTGGKDLSQAMHWNGRSWSRTFPPQPAGSGPGDVNILYVVTCTSARSCWAVGSYGKNGATEFMRNQALHWNGLHWLLVRTPNPANAPGADTDGLLSVRCTDRANCWAVGTQQHGMNASNEILHWNGRKWQVWT